MLCAKVPGCNKRNKAFIVLKHNGGNVFFQIEKQNKNLSMRTTGKWLKFSDPFSCHLAGCKYPSGIVDPRAAWIT